MSARMGYVVVEINQASGQPENIDPELFPGRELAETAAAIDREDTAAIGRRERYVVCEVIPIGEPS